jgi:hypothetical protein
MFARQLGVVAFIGLVLATFATSKGEDKKPPAAPPTTASPLTAPPTERVVGPLSAEDAKALATMNDRLKEYIALHTQLESTLPALSTDATPQQIDKNQRAFEVLLRSARASAKQGDIFTPEATPVIKRLLATVFGGPDGQKLKHSIMDENVDVTVSVNGRYPDSVPLASVPPQVLQTLPKLSEDLEYRFIGDRLILLDTHAHVIVDFINKALPKK